MTNTIGKKGENLATDYLRNNGFKIKEKNYWTQWGEIDIIAEKNDTLYFIEVKSRQTLTFGMPYEAVNFYKIKALKRAVAYYIKIKNIKNKKFSLSIISIILSRDLTKNVIKLYNFNEVSDNLYGSSY